VIRVPEVTQPGSASEALVELVDLFPTLSELCNVPVPGDVQGKSRISVLRDPQADGRPFVYTVVTRGPVLGRAIRTARWRYARWEDGEELYDLEHDINEFRNVATHSDYKDTLSSMRLYLNIAEGNAAAQRH
jgi:uncharacterized sulfatase